ncbi:hypothetical protein M9H77_18111 [Catharanthus roseus]|uniref:Uncharacterized protein n=1 Tax=Catharanthus roseus TaxID=4058 RepID=A0ACC0B6U5_CATRO|nr:hypothetical protein M9H77_18111 [Catharanthus roseus]
MRLINGERISHSVSIGHCVLSARRKLKTKLDRVMEVLENRSEGNFTFNERERERESLWNHLTREGKDQESRREWKGEVDLSILPNGIMAISQRKLDNDSDDEVVDVKIGPNSASGSHLYLWRRFRSKNIEPLPISTMQVVFFEIC